MRKWIEVNELGELVIEIILVRFDVPLLFVCLDRNNNRYMVLCVDEEEGKYLLAKCSNQKIIRMLNDESPMDEIFKCAVDGKCIMINYNFEKRIFENNVLKSEDLTADILPDQGAYFELRNSKIKEYITKLEDELCSVITMKIKSFSNNYIAKKEYDFTETTSEMDVLEERKMQRKAIMGLYCLMGKIQYINDVKFEEENLQYSVYKLPERRGMYAI